MTGLIILADGMGGHSDGEKASKYVVEKFMLCFEREYKEVLRGAQDEQHAALALKNAALEASRCLKEEKQRNRIGADAGCTLIAACTVRHSGKVYFLSIGDSLIFVKHKGRPWEWVNKGCLDTRLRELRMVANDARKFGLDSPEYRRALSNVRTDPKRHGLTQAVTGNRVPDPHILAHEILFEAGDRIILASDGILPLLGDKDEDDPDFSELDSILEQNPVPNSRLPEGEQRAITKRTAEWIVSAVLSKRKPNQDNVTVLLAEVSSPQGARSVPPNPPPLQLHPTEPRDEYEDDIDLNDENQVNQRHGGSPGKTLLFVFLLFFVLGLGVVIGVLAQKADEGSQNASSKDNLSPPPPPPVLNTQEEKAEDSNGGKDGTPVSSEAPKEDDAPAKASPDVSPKNPYAASWERTSGGEDVSEDTPQIKLGLAPTNGAARQVSTVSGEEREKENSRNLETTGVVVVDNGTERKGKKEETEEKVPSPKGTNEEASDTRIPQETSEGGGKDGVKDSNEADASSGSAPEPVVPAGRDASTSSDGNTSKATNNKGKNTKAEQLHKTIEAFIKELYPERRDDKQIEGRQSKIGELEKCLDELIGETEKEESKNKFLKEAAESLKIAVEIKEGSDETILDEQEGGVVAASNEFNEKLEAALANDANSNMECLKILDEFFSLTSSNIRIGIVVSKKFSKKHTDIFSNSVLFVLTVTHSQGGQVLPDEEWLERCENNLSKYDDKVYPHICKYIKNIIEKYKDEKKRNQKK